MSALRPVTELPWNQRVDHQRVRLVGDFLGARGKCAVPCPQYRPDLEAGGGTYGLNALRSLYVVKLHNVESDLARDIRYLPGLLGGEDANLSCAPTRQDRASLRGQTLARAAREDHAQVIRTGGVGELCVLRAGEPADLYLNHGACS